MMTKEKGEEGVCVCCCLLSEVFLDTVRDGGIGHGEETTGRCPRCEPLPCSVTMGTTFIAADADSNLFFHAHTHTHTHIRRVMDKMLTVLDTGLCGQQAIQCGSHKTIHTVIEMTTYHTRGESLDHGDEVFLHVLRRVGLGHRSQTLHCLVSHYCLRHGS